MRVMGCDLFKEIYGNHSAKAGLDLINAPGDVLCQRDWQSRGCLHMWRFDAAPSPLLRRDRHTNGPTTAELGLLLVNRAV